MIIQTTRGSYILDETGAPVSNSFVKRSTEMTDKYVNKRREVDARQLTASNVDEIVRWCAGERREEKDPFTMASFVAINMPTLNGVERVQEGDYVVRHPSGTFTKMSRFAFEQEYERQQQASDDVRSAMAESARAVVDGLRKDPREPWRTV